MSLKERNLVTELEFGPELADQRVGWSAITSYGDAHPGRMIVAHLVTTTIGEDGASLEYEAREKDGETQKAYWSDAAKGFVAPASVSVIIDTEKGPDEQQRVGPYWSLKDGVINGSSDGRILRQTADGRSDEAELAEKKVWADSPTEVMGNTKNALSDAGLEDYYPLVYYTANILLAHEGLRDGNGFYNTFPLEAAIMPDSSMRATTQQEWATAEAIVNNLLAEDQEDETMLQNLTVFGDVPADQIPQTFRLSRGKIAEAEQQAIAAEKELHAQHGVFLPIGFHGGRSWPFMNASLPSTDERAFGMEIDRLREGKLKLVIRELERERDELFLRIRFANRGVHALQLLERAEAEL